MGRIVEYMHRANASLITELYRKQKAAVRIISISPCVRGGVPIYVQSGLPCSLTSVGWKQPCYAFRRRSKIKVAKDEKTG
jgi:hypothetical protein